MKERMKLILRIIATGVDMLLETKVDLRRAQPLYRGSIEGLWMARP
jgi:hypothetical protein